MYTEITPNNGLVQFRYQNGPDYNSQIIDFTKLKQDLVVKIKYENGAWSADHTYADMKQAITNGVLVRLTDETNERFSVVSGYTEDTLYFNTDDADGSHTYTVTDANAWDLRSLPITDVLIATYGTTTYSEIATAYNAGKVVVCRDSDGAELRLVFLSSAYAYFTAIIASPDVRGQYARCRSNNTWDSGVFDVNETYYAEYGTALYNDVSYHANDLNQIVYSLYDNKVYILVNKGIAQDPTLVFACADGATLRQLTLSSSNTWSNATVGLEQTSNKVTSISASSTDTQYPSAKCVYDEVSQLGQEVNGYAVSFRKAGAKRTLSSPIPAGSTIVSLSEQVATGIITLYQENDSTGDEYNIADLPIATTKVYVAAKVPGDDTATIDINIAGVAQELQVVKVEAFGGERSFYFRASGARNYAPLKKGDIITASDVLPFSLRETEESTVSQNVSALPFECQKDYAVIVKYVSGSPIYTITYHKAGLQGDINTLNDALYGGVERTYTRLAGGAVQELDTPIEKGDIITSVICQGLTSFGLRDENDNNTSVAVASLPFTADKKYVSWSAYVSGAPSLVMVVKSPSVTEEVESNTERIEQLEAESGAKFPDTFLPAKIYGVIGDTLQIFNRGVVRGMNPYEFYNKFTCGQGKVYDRYLEVTPALNNGLVPSNLTIKHNLINDYANESTQKTATFKIAARPSSPPASNINVLCVGASTTAGGEWVAELLRRLTGTRDSGSPAADGLSNITFVGRKLANGVHLEATGGWAWNTFYTPMNALRFQVTGVSYVNIGDVYSFVDANSKTVKIQVAEVNVTGDTGNIRFLYTYDTESQGVPTTASGTITKVSGSGDGTITYTSYAEENYAPFYEQDISGCGFEDYADTYCNGSIDVAVFLLGALNSGVIGTASLDGVIASMKTMLDALHRDFPNCKAIIGTPIGVSQQHGAEYNYGAASNYTQWSIMYVNFRYAQALQDFVSGDDYKDWCFLANPLGEVDSEYVFPTTSKPVNVRMSTPTEEIGTNGAHPTNAGYMMTADSFYRCFVNEILA